MKCYLSYFKLRFINDLQYRAAAWAGIATQIFFGLVYIMIYIAFYESGQKSLPMELPQLITYVWLNQLFLTLLSLFYKDMELFNLVKTGNLAYELVRPKNLFFMWYIKILGQRFSKVLLRAIPGLIIILLMPKGLGMIPPVSVEHFLLFVITLLSGTLLMATIIVLYPILTIYTLNEKGIVEMVISIAEIFSGLIVPIPFFPKFLKVISSCLPFQYVSDLSFRIYVGNISISAGLTGLLIQIIWTIILMALGYFLMQKALKRAIVQGG